MPACLWMSGMGEPAHPLYFPGDLMPLDLTPHRILPDR